VREAAELIGVDFIDHLIVSEHSHYSFRETDDWLGS
jgi:DNA repair protein RadC